MEETYRFSYLITVNRRLLRLLQNGKSLDVYKRQIDDSEIVDGGWVEPENKTIEAGVRASVQF